MASRIGHIGADNRWRFQVALSVCLLGVAVTYLFNSVEQVAQQSERQGVRMMLNQFRSALVVKGAEILLSDGNFEQWRGLNPAQLLEQPPANWDGLCSDSQPAPGRWCFQADRSWVVYRPRTDVFEAADGRDDLMAAAGGLMTLQVVPEYARSARDGNRRAVGLTLIHVKSGQKPGDTHRD
ncbi:hypothetical protein [Marinobacter oulmenensis]|uniref:Uncharacterized protein n=1 Tax=Marinobacter oulmenensis TaxID=643747 RepID=A0A840UB80_9GAMM|nr:hypothetical protein [Marinobacter oulmenensis]MBB5322262.1 hypothetical protein [Marinobacter oulmenensis]